MGTLSIDGLRHSVRLGCKEEERAFPQVVTTDLTIHTDMTDCIASDDIADAVDYEAIANAVVRMSKDGEWRLIERLASDIGKTVLAEAARADRVDVRVTKIILPQASGVRTDVTVSRSND